MRVRVEDGSSRKDPAWWGATKCTRHRAASLWAQHARRVAGMQGQEKGGMPLLSLGRDTSTRARCRVLCCAGRGSQA